MPSYREVKEVYRSSTLQDFTLTRLFRVRHWQDPKRRLHLNACQPSATLLLTSINNHSSSLNPNPLWFKSLPFQVQA